MLRRLAFVFVLLLPLLAAAQTWSDTITVTVCESGDCSEAVTMTRDEELYLDQLLANIDGSATEAKISLFFGSGPFARSPTAKSTEWQGKTIQRLGWFVNKNSKSSSEAHVDVYFVDGRPFMFKWWSRSLRRSISATLVK